MFVQAESDLLTITFFHDISFDWLALCMGVFPKGTINNNKICTSSEDFSDYKLYLNFEFFVRCASYRTAILTSLRFDIVSCLPDRKYWTK